MSMTYFVINYTSYILQDQAHILEYVICDIGIIWRGKEEEEK